MTQERSGLARGLTVQGWLNLVLSVMGVVVLAGGIAAAVLLTRSDDVVSGTHRRARTSADLRLPAAGGVAGPGDGGPRIPHFR